MESADAPLGDPSSEDRQSRQAGPSGEAGRRLAQLDSIGAHLDSVEAALAALDDGSYGRCRRCGELIADEILARDPLAGDCHRHGDGAPSPVDGGSGRQDGHPREGCDSEQPEE